MGDTIKVVSCDGSSTAEPEADQQGADFPRGASFESLAASFGKDPPRAACHILRLPYPAPAAREPWHEDIRTGRNRPDPRARQSQDVYRPCPSLSPLPDLSPQRESPLSSSCQVQVCLAALIPSTILRTRDHLSPTTAVYLLHRTIWTIIRRHLLKSSSTTAALAYRSFTFAQ